MANRFSGQTNATTVMVALQALLIVAASCWIYYPSLHGGWIMDDFFYLAQNPEMHDPARIWRAWFQPGSFVEYYPIEETVQWLQWQLWGSGTLGYHLTNLVLHIASAFLVWRLLSKFGLRWAWLGGLIFAIHPANVESVAWISELKNTLSLPPLLLATCFYLDYEATGRRSWYAWSLLLFLAAMLCKVSMVLFPLVLPLYAWWKRGRIQGKDLWAAIPFMFISVVLGLLAIYCGSHFEQMHGARQDPVPIGGLLSRMALAGLATSFYLLKSLIPVDQMFVYPQWRIDPPTLWQFLPWPLFAGLFYGLWARRETWGRHALLGLGFFLILLAPFVGQKISYMRFTWVMDHFLYIPLIGVIGLVIAAMENEQRRLSVLARRGGAILIGILIVLLSWESHSYARVFKSSETLWTDTIRHNPAAWIAYNNLGEALARRGEIAGAMQQYEKALVVDSALTGPHVNLGNALQDLGRFQDAIGEYQQALAIQPDTPEAENNWGNALASLGRPRDGIEKYRKAIQLDPDYVEARTDLGITLISLGQTSEGIEQYREAIRLEPEDAHAHYDLGVVLGENGQLPEAIREFQEAVRIDPRDAAAFNNLGVALYKNGQVTEAMAAYQRARELQAASQNTQPSP
jgi:tetratricopeptide (TPR) repeat protein